MKNKISLFTRFPKSWEISALKQAATKEKANLKTIVLRSPKETANVISNLGPVVIWRSSCLSKLQRKLFLAAVTQNSFLINKTIYQNPSIASKIYQQKVLKDCPYIEGIPSYCFSNKNQILQLIEGKKLRFPLVAKTDIGSQGKGVFLIKNENEIKKIKKEEINNYLFQNFIENSGDYRILILGGKVLEMMKRISQNSKDFRNNISQGGKAIKVTNEATRKILTNIALQTAAIFNLYFTGVDIIYNQREKKYQVLEVNTVPQWRGLQKIIPFNIARQIIIECQQLASRNKKDTYQIVENYHEKFFSFLNLKKFHYSSRMFFWLGRKKDRQRLTVLKKEYLGKDLKETKKKLSQILENNRFHPSSKIPLSERARLRHQYFQKYPQLQGYIRILFKNIFISTIYKQSLRPIVKTLISDRQFLNLYFQLIKDQKAIQILSTHAINYFYLLRYYLRKSNAGITINPKYFYQIAQKINCQENKTRLALKIYLFTHCIVGESCFYSHPIDKKNVYIQMIKTLEKLIKENFFAVSLDNKLEFLVCANILNYQSALKGLIHQEADRSLSNLGNFIVDRYNDHQQKETNNFIKAEHRNVLYLISYHPYPPNKQK